MTTGAVEEIGSFSIMLLPVGCTTKLLRVMLGGSTEIKLTAEYKQESKGNGSQ